jgi:hypothetical protein
MGNGREGDAVTEQEWLSCDDPTPMLEFLRGKASKRKLRLFAVACCRHVWRFFSDERSRRAVEVCELYLAGLADQAEVERAAAAVRQAVQNKWDEVREARRVADARGRDAAFFAARVKRLEAEFAAQWIAEQLGQVDEALTAALASWGVAWVDAGTREEERKVQSDVLRDIVPNPFRTVRLDPAWLTPQVVALAGAAGDDAAGLPALAGALEEAGCHDEALLQHCRSSGPHVRGCWAIELLLGRS